MPIAQLSISAKDQNVAKTRDNCAVARRAVVLDESGVQRLVHRSRGDRLTSGKVSEHLERLDPMELDLIALYEYSEMMNKFDSVVKIMFPIMFMAFNVVYFVFVYTKRFEC